MLLTSKYFVIIDLSLEVLVRYPVFFQLVKPILAPFSVCCVPWSWKLPNSNSFRFTAGSTANYGAVISRHVFQLNYIGSYLGQLEMKEFKFETLPSTIQDVVL